MTKSFLKKCATVGSIAVFAVALVYACGWYDESEYGDSAFTPEVFVDQAYSPFFRSTNWYYKIGYDEPAGPRFNEQIVQEWAAWLGVAANDSGLRFCLLKASAGFIDTLSSSKQKAGKTTALNFDFLRKADKEKVKQFFSFLRLAKRNEVYAAPEYNPWSYEPAEMPSMSADDIARIQAMQDALKRTTDTFLRQRYIFQIVRGYFFNHNYDAAIAYYDNNAPAVSETPIVVRALSYVAGAYKQKGDTAKANYLYAQVFARSNAMKVPAHFSFRPQSEESWQATLALAKDKSELENLWLLSGLYDRPLRAMKEIYAINPKSKHLNLLLAYNVNAAEASVFDDNDGRSLGFLGDLGSRDRDGFKAISAIADAKNTADPAMWFMAAGYLSYLHNKPVQAASYFAQAEKMLPPRPNVSAQLRLLRAMNTAGAVQKIDKAFEEKFLPELVWLENMADEDDSLRHVFAYHKIKETLSRKYLAAGDSFRSEIFVHTDEFFASRKRTEAMERFLSASEGSPVEQYFRTIYPFSAGDVNEYLAIQDAYAGKLESAYALMDKASGKNDTLLGNPFNNGIQDCHDCDHAAMQKIKYTKQTFLRALIDMQQRLSKGTDVFSNAHLLGNAFYNMSHYGNARIFYECAIVGEGSSSPMLINEVFRGMVIAQAQPKKYFKQALAAAKNDEQRAKMTYLILKCERNEFYTKWFNESGPTAWDWYEGMPPVAYANLFPFRNTQYYKEIINECGYFRSFAERNANLPNAPK